MPRLFSEQRKFLCPNKLKTLVMEKIKENVHLFPVSQLNTLDGLRFEFDDSWMLIRASGTEPVIRVIAESTSKAETEALLGRGVQAMESVLGELMI